MLSGPLLGCGIVTITVIFFVGFNQFAQLRGAVIGQLLLYVCTQISQDLLGILLRE